MFENKVGRPSNETLKKRRLFKIGAAAFAIVVIGTIAAVTYARYRASTVSVGNVNVAKWNISFKDGSNTVLSQQNTVTFTPSSSSYVASGKIAPSSTLTATVKIDPNDSEVAVDYYISIPKSSLSIGGNNNLTVSSITATTNNVANTLTVNDTTLDSVAVYKTDTTLIPLSAIASGNGLTTIVITLQWNDSENNGANATATSLSIPVTLYAQQHLTSDDV